MEETTLSVEARLRLVANNLGFHYHEGMAWRAESISKSTVLWLLGDFKRQGSKHFGPGFNDDQELKAMAGFVCATFHNYVLSALRISPQRYQNSSYHLLNALANHFTRYGQVGQSGMVFKVKNDLADTVSELRDMVRPTNAHPYSTPHTTGIRSRSSSSSHSPSTRPVSSPAPARPTKVANTKSASSIGPGRMIAIAGALFLLLILILSSR